LLFIIQECHRRRENNIIKYIFPFLIVRVPHSCLVQSFKLYKACRYM
jgi:hypothetical protein